MTHALKFLSKLSKQSETLSETCSNIFIVSSFKPIISQNSAILYKHIPSHIHKLCEYLKNFGFLYCSCSTQPCEDKIRFIVFIKSFTNVASFLPFITIYYSCWRNGKQQRRRFNKTPKVKPIYLVRKRESREAEAWAVVDILT